jgi:O-methyltransferase
VTPQPLPPLTSHQADAYLRLMAKTLARFPLETPDLPLISGLRGIDHPSCRELRRWLLGNISGQHDERSAAALRTFGLDWPTEAETMIGLVRLDNIRACATDALAQGVPGDFVETGVWRGGACIYLRAILAAYGDHDRRVWVADSFQGVPPPDPDMYPADGGDTLFAYRQLAVSLPCVQQNFRRYGFADRQVRFLPGWFRDTLPDAPVDRLAVLRLDGDLYESTIVALRSLYRKVSPGGYVIIDDYGAIPACKQAVDDFRDEMAIREPLARIDWTGVFWRVEDCGRDADAAFRRDQPAEASPLAHHRMR